MPKRPFKFTDSAFSSQIRIKQQATEAKKYFKQNKTTYLNFSVSLKAVIVSSFYAHVNFLNY